MKFSEEDIDANLADTFPASDPPGWTLGHDPYHQESSPEMRDKKSLELMKVAMACLLHDSQSVDEHAQAAQKAGADAQEVAEMRRVLEKVF